MSLPRARHRNLLAHLREDAIRHGGDYFSILIFIPFHIYDEVLKIYFQESSFNGTLRIFIPDRIFCLTFLLAFLLGEGVFKM